MPVPEFDESDRMVLLKALKSERGVYIKEWSAVRENERIPFHIRGLDSDLIDKEIARAGELCQRVSDAICTTAEEYPEHAQQLAAEITREEVADAMVSIPLRLMPIMSVTATVGFHAELSRLGASCATGSVPRGNQQALAQLGEHRLVYEVDGLHKLDSNVILVLKNSITAERIGRKMGC